MRPLTIKPVSRRPRPVAARARLAVGLLMLAVTAAACGRPHSDLKVRESRTLLGTFVHVDVCYTPAEEARLRPAYAQVWQRLTDINQRMNAYDADSEIGRLNRAYPDAVTVQPDTYQVLAAAQGFSGQTQGAFDITVGPLLRLWRQAAEVNQMPTPAEVARVRQSVGPQQVVLLPDGQVRLQGPQAAVDLGAIAKGYAVDEAARILRAAGLANFFIDAGGDIYVGGQSCAGRPWRIGIQDPRDADAIMEVVELSNAAVTTSGDYEQFYEVRGRRFSHIVNPATGYPTQEVISATVIAPSAQQADAYSTALSVLPPAQGQGLIDGLGHGLAALMVTRDEQGGLRSFPSRDWAKFLHRP